MLLVYRTDVNAKDQVGKPPPGIADYKTLETIKQYLDKQNLVTPKTHSL